MFPSTADIEKFKFDFGPESQLIRTRVSDPDRNVTCLAAAIGPQSTKALTLEYAWELMRALAEWILERTERLPSTERYSIFVEWSPSVRTHRGRIFALWLPFNELRTVSESATWMDYQEIIKRPVPMKGWEKDVFPNDSDDQDGQFRQSSRLDAP